MYSGKGKGSVKNQYFDGGDYVNNGMRMGIPKLGLSRSLSSGYGYGLWGDGSSSSSSFSPFDHSVNQALNGRMGSVLGYNEQKNLEGLVERGLCDDLYRMHIGKGGGAGDYGKIGSNEESGVRFEEPWLNGTVGSDLNKYLFRGGKVYNLGNDSVDSLYRANQKERFDHLLDMSKGGQKKGYYTGESEFQNPCVMSRPVFGDGSEGLFSPRYHPGYPGIDDVSVGDNNLLSPFLSSQMMKPRQGYDCSSSVLNNQWPRGFPNAMVEPSFLSNSRDFDTVGGSKQSFFALEEALKCYANDNLNFLKAQKMNEVAMPRFREKNLKTYNQECQPGGFCQVGSYCDGSCEGSFGISVNSPVPLPPVQNSLVNAQDYICRIAKDQLGCRILQKAFDQGTSQDVKIIFDGIIDHIVEFMVDQFGNYLVQKLLNFCNDEQRLQIVLRATREPGQLVRISLDTHGTRVVQKLIETMKTRQEVSLLIQALEPGFLDLATDLNGNHVLQKCLQTLSKENNKFIMNAAAKFCFEIATHRYGCCVLNKCIGYASGKQRDKLLACISYRALLHAQDAFGNYVIQYIIELKNHSTASVMLSQFKGNFIHLSKQKFSSHVVEKCLKFIEESRAIIIHELISVPQFELLLQDPFANYVIQSALGVAKGTLRALLVDAVRPHMNLLRSNPFCKKILSQNILKKK